MSDEHNVFEGEKVDKIVFRPISLDMTAKVKKVSDPPPRPIPAKLDDRSTDEWQPKVKKGFNGKQLFESMQKVGNVLKYVMFTSAALASLAAVGWVVFWLMDQYNL